MVNLPSFPVKGVGNLGILAHVPVDERSFGPRDGSALPPTTESQGHQGFGLGEEPRTAGRRAEAVERAPARV